MSGPRLDTTALLRAIVESSDTAIISTDLDGIVTSWNRAAEVMLGYAAAEIIGRSVRLVIPADRQREEDHALEVIRRNEPVPAYETVRLSKTGQLVPISLRGFPLRDENGVVVAAAKIGRDISDLRRAEAAAEYDRQQDAFLAQVTATLTQSFDYTRTLATIAEIAVPRIADWCAVDVVEDDQVARVAHAHVDPSQIETMELVHRQADPTAPTSPCTVIRTRQSSLIPEITDERIVAAAGADQSRLELLRSIGFSSYLCVPMIARGRCVGAITFTTTTSKRRFTDEDRRFAEDVAARAALAVENTRAYEALQTANRLKDEFLATLSHELRTPLNAVLGYTRMLRAGVIAAERHAQALEVIERNASSLAQIVEDVLDVSRIVSGKARLNVQTVDLSKVLGDAIATVLPAADAKGVRIETSLDALARAVSGDPDRLQQVVWNLLSNAVKFTPRGGRVDMQLARGDAQVEIVVSDTGAGIPASFLPHIFERFRQAEGGTTRQHGGLGLGLAIARHIVEMHGGTIQAASDGEGRGATFRVRLPLVWALPAAGDRERVVPRAGRHEALGLRSAHLAGVSVLAVDDDEDALTMVRDILQSAGAKVTIVDSAQAALERLEVDRPSVLVADLGMPVIDGFDFIARVRSLSNEAVRTVPAAALTAYARSEDSTRSLKSGFDLHLAKPIDPAALVEAVAALARQRHPSA